MSRTRIAWIILIGVVATSMAPNALGCPVCFGDPDSALTKGMSNGIFVLLGFIGIVQIGFIALFWSFWQRAKRMREAGEQFELVEGGAK